MIRFIEFIIRYCEFGGRKAKYINKAKRTQEETQNETKKRTPTAQKNNYTKSLVKKNILSGELQFKQLQKRCLKNSGFDGIRISQILVGLHYQLSYETTCWERGRFAGKS